MVRDRGRGQHFGLEITLVSKTQHHWLKCEIGCDVKSAAVPGRLLSAVLHERVPVDGLVRPHAARQDLGQLAIRHVQAGRAQVLRDVHHYDDPRQQHGSRT